MAFKIAPTCILGSKPASMKHKETIEVVVVFPWVPETPIVFSKALVSIPKKSHLSIVGIFNSFALTISGSVSFIAAE